MSYKYKNIDAGYVAIVAVPQLARISYGILDSCIQLRSISFGVCELNSKKRLERTTTAHKGDTIETNLDVHWCNASDSTSTTNISYS